MFIICPLKSEDSPTRKRSDQLRRHIIEPAAKDKGYDVVRSDTLSEPGRIDQQIVDHLLDDDLVVCDLTEHNPNVLYELAICHAIRKSVILLGEKDTRPPFDLYSQRVISYDLTNPDKVVESKEELVKQIESIEEDAFTVDSPIRGTESIVMKGTKSTNIDDTLHEMMNILRNLTDRIRRLEDRRSVGSTRIFDTSPQVIHKLETLPSINVSDYFKTDFVKLITECPNCNRTVLAGQYCSNCGHPLTSEGDTKTT